MSHRSVCSHHSPHPPPLTSPRHTAPCLQLSTLTPPPPYFNSAHLMLPLLFFSSSPFVLSPYLFTPPCLHHFFFLVCVTVSFVSFTSSHLPHSPSPLLLWMDRDFLFTTGNAVPALLTSQQEGISASDKPEMLVFLTASHVSLSGARVWVCVCLTHGLLSSQTEGLL